MPTVSVKLATFTSFLTLMTFHSVLKEAISDVSGMFHFSPLEKRIKFSLVGSPLLIGLGTSFEHFEQFKGLAHLVVFVKCTNPC